MTEVLDIPSRAAINLCEHCSTFPSPPEHEVFRDAIVSHLRDSFSPERRVIMVEGANGSGKTTLLSQFARMMPDRALSFFVGDDYWSSNVGRFLLDLCEQMKFITPRKVVAKIGSLNEYELKQLFNALYADLVKRAKKENKPFYFVVDGLELIPDGYGQETILDLLPTSLTDNIYLLMSSTPGKNYRFNYQSWPMYPFLIQEAEQYLANQMTSQQIRQLYDSCNGNPGYLAQISRQIKSGAKIDDILSNLPRELARLIEQEWSRLDQDNKPIFDLIAILAFSPKQLSIQELSQISGMDKNIVSSIVNCISFISEDQKLGYLKFETFTHKQLASSKLEYLRTQAEQSLINYYKTKPDEKDAFISLPHLYQRTSDLAGIVNLLNIESLVNQLGAMRNIALVRRNLRILAEMAFAAGDWEHLAWAGLTEAIFTHIATKAPALKAEIEALVSLGYYDRALNLSCSCVLPEDRLQLLAMVCSQMIKSKKEIPTDILTAVEDSVNMIDNTLELTPELTDKIIDVAVDLFPVQVSFALRLLERVAEVTGIQDHRGHLIDLILAKLLLKLEPHAESVEAIRSQIGDESLRSFARAASSLKANTSPEEVLREVAGVTDTSAKLFLLQTWCNTNSTSQDAPIVIEHALSILTTDYTPTQRQIREIIEPLRNTLDLEIARRLVAQADILKDTAIPNPLEEKFRLELTLAAIERKWSPEIAMERLYDRIYFRLEDIADLDTQCYVMAEILVNLREIAPDDLMILEEIREELPKKYKKLLEVSADHLAIALKILTTVAKYDIKMAIEFAQMINTDHRRNVAYSQILRVYTRKNNEHFNIDEVFVLLDKITDPLFRDWVFVQVIMRLSNNNITLGNHVQNELLHLINNIYSSAGKAYAYAYSLGWLMINNEQIQKDLLTGLKQSLSSLDDINSLAHIGFHVINIIAKRNCDHAQEVLDFIKAKKTRSGFLDGRIAEIYIETCRLAIRLTPDFIQGKDPSGIVDVLINAIKKIPPASDRCSLFTSLAIRCRTAKRIDLFERIVKECMNIILDLSVDNDTYIESLIVSAPLLFEYEREILYQKIATLAPALNDRVLYEVVNYIFSGRTSDDLIDPDNLKRRVDFGFADAQRICDILTKMKQDSAIYEVISRLTDTIVEQIPHNKIKCIFRERESLTIAECIANIISSKLPDPKNITHNGYVIVSQACLAKLRDAALATTPYRANERWKKLCPSWEELVALANQLTNDADRTFVLALIGKKAYLVNQHFADDTLKMAEESQLRICNNVDRADRFYSLADAYHAISNNRASQFLMEKALECVKLYSTHEGKEQLIGNILELAHSIDPNFAISIASKVDDPAIEFKIKDDLQVLNLHSDPQKIDQCDHDTCRIVIGPSCRRILRSLYSGRGLVQHDKVIGNWIHKSLGQSYETFSLAVSWLIENTISGRKRPEGQMMGNLLEKLIGLLEMMMRIQQLIDESSATFDNTSLISPMSITNLLRFGLGQRREAVDTITKWLSSNVLDYVKICDPYIEPQDIEIIMAIPQQARVYVLTSIRNQGKGSQRNAIHELETQYRNAWSKICDQLPPEAHFYLCGTTSGRTPLHNRYIITNSAGLELGTSLNGFGNKESTIRFLDIEEKSQIEREMIDPYLAAPPPSMPDGEKLTIHTFTL